MNKAKRPEQGRHGYAIGLVSTVESIIKDVWEILHTY